MSGETGVRRGIAREQRDRIATRLSQRGLRECVLLRFAGTIRAGNMRSPKTNAPANLGAGSKYGHRYLLTELPGHGNVFVIVDLVALAKCPGRLGKRLRAAPPHTYMFNVMCIPS
jgi:hypothetical protein